MAGCGHGLSVGHRHLVVYAMTTDEELEHEIEDAYEAVLRARGDEQVTTAWQTMRTLINQRSPQRVEDMERARGLR